MKTLKIGNLSVGNGHPAYIVAEIGLNHNGDMDLAKETISAAADAGANSVKFQNYITEDFISDRNLIYKYISQGKEVEEPQYEMFKRYEISRSDLEQIAEYCRQNKVGFHSTPTNIEGVKLLFELGVPVLKNGSDYLVNLPLIRTMGETGLPTIISTGMATLGEIDDAVRVFRETGNDKLILLHCTSSYPTPSNEVNIRRVKTLADAFGSLTGFSDHTEGVTAAVLSIAYGACWIEKHFTLDRKLPGPDHCFSSNPEEMRQLVNAIREAERMLGTTDVSPTKSERSSRSSFRLSCAAKKDMAKGEMITPGDIVFTRPGDGISPSQSEFLVGMKLRRPITEGELFNTSHFHG